MALDPAPLILTHAWAAVDDPGGSRNRDTGFPGDVVDSRNRDHLLCRDPIPGPSVFVSNPS